MRISNGLSHIQTCNDKTKRYIIEISSVDPNIKVQILHKTSFLALPNHPASFFPLPWNDPLTLALNNHASTVHRLRSLLEPVGVDFDRVLLWMAHPGPVEFGLELVHVLSLHN